ncbi:unnamed protein product [Calicophoron daubneyi]|uniref:Uncharacterized protein n=1 Tax=Calicophoron daubneyi TaxID=300641 RepID=A0AAV2T7M6_CALDB
MYACFWILLIPICYLSTQEVIGSKDMLRDTLVDAHSTLKGATEEAETRRRLIDSYKRHEIPKNDALSPYFQETGKRLPLFVDVNLFVYSFSSISVVDMDYTIDFLLRQRWMDERLKFIAMNDTKMTPISYLRDQLWLPDLFFRNAKDGFLHKITLPNYLIWIDPQGVITFSQKLSIKASCHMTLWNFPMDTQICKISIGSYGYAKEDLEFRWWSQEEYSPLRNSTKKPSPRKPIEMRSGLEINEFTLTSYGAFYCSIEYSSTGSFSCLEVEFQLQRRFGFYLIYAYLPSMLVVSIAWVSFLLDPSAVPGRVSIGLLCVLALITQSAAILTQLPRVSYIKAMDIWVFVCLAFVVSSLLEFAAANTVSRKTRGVESEKEGPALQHKLCVLTTPSALVAFVKSEKCGASPDSHSRAQPAQDEGEGVESPNQKVPQESAENSSAPGSPLITIQGRYIDSCECASSDRAHRLDILFAIGYPILFIIFNVAYWSYYLLYMRSD